ncbi:MAG: hypothetical protein JW991_01520 [Candidatus Pacebacteria bacterium]|nr:hypothetical protein [Candidatus Paceibacterota bacterium]
MKEATEVKKSCPCLKQPSGAVVVKDGKIIGQGKNATRKVEVCPRNKQGYGTGKGYHLCREICGQEAHTEIAAIKDAQRQGFDTRGADLYLDGHWCCCKNCWDVMIGAGIRNVYLRKNAHFLYRKS